MKQLICLATLFFAFHCTVVQAQNHEKITVRQGDNFSALFYYRFPSFTAGTVKLKNGQELSLKLNFNLLTCELQFIDPHGDTLSVATPEDVEAVAIEQRIFFYDKGYYEIFASADSAKLAIFRKVNYETIKIGAMGIRNHSGTGVQGYSTLLMKSGERQLIVNEDVDILKETTYFLITGSGEMIKASKSGYLKLFPNKTDRITSYLKTNKISFDKENDLKKLFDFCINS